jgi:hypothetical protein
MKLSISPAQVELVIKPGIKVTQAFDIQNLSDSPQIVTTSILPWLPKGSNGSVTYDSVTTPPGLYFELNNSDLRLGQPFRLGPGQSQQLVLKISSDTNFAPTDAYYTLFISQEPSAVADGNSTSVSARIGSHLLLSFSPSQNLPQKTTTIFTISPQIKDIFLTPLNFSGQITNSTSHFTKIQDQIIITKNNLEISRLTLAPDNILANNSRPFRCLDSQKLPVNCFLKPPFWPGLYTATLGQTSVNFYILPLSPLILITFLLIIRLLTTFRPTTNIKSPK